jgi:hypothetical protein
MRFSPVFAMRPRQKSSKWRLVLLIVNAISVAAAIQFTSATSWHFLSGQYRGTTSLNSGGSMSQNISGSKGNSPNIISGGSISRSISGTCPQDMIYSRTHRDCIPIQNHGGIIPCSPDDMRFVPGRGWVSNCMAELATRPSVPILPIQNHGGIISCMRFVPGRGWVSNCMAELATRPSVPIPRPRPPFKKQEHREEDVAEAIMKLDTATHPREIGAVISETLAMHAPIMKPETNIRLTGAIVQAFQRVNERAIADIEYRANKAIAEVQAEANRAIAAANSMADLAKWVAIVISIITAFGILFGAWNGRLTYLIAKREKATSP